MFLSRKIKKIPGDYKILVTLYPLPTGMKSWRHKTNKFGRLRQFKHVLEYIKTGTIITEMI